MKREPDSLCLLLAGSFFTQCNSCLPTARGSLPLTRAGIFTGQSTFSDRRSFVRVAAVAQKKKTGTGQPWTTTPINFLPKYALCQEHCPFLIVDLTFHASDVLLKKFDASRHAGIVFSWTLLVFLNVRVHCQSCKSKLVVWPLFCSNLYAQSGFM